LDTGGSSFADSGSGDGGGFNEVLIAPIVIGVLAAFTIVVVVIVVGLITGAVYKRRRERVFTEMRARTETLATMDGNA